MTLEYLTFAVLIFIVTVAWITGSYNPTNRKRYEIATTAIQEYIEQWYGGQSEEDHWVCVKRYTCPTGGPFGSPLPIIVLSRGDQRIILCCEDPSIEEETKVYLRSRRPSEKANVCVSAVDQYMIPSIL